MSIESRRSEIKAIKAIKAMEADLLAAVSSADRAANDLRAATTRRREIEDLLQEAEAHETLSRWHRDVAAVSSADRAANDLRAATTRRREIEDLLQEAEAHEALFRWHRDATNIFVEQMCRATPFP
jgi:hypothetical protein